MNNDADAEIGTLMVRIKADVAQYEKDMAEAIAVTKRSTQEIENTERASKNRIAAQAEMAKERAAAKEVAPEIEKAASSFKDMLTENAAIIGTVAATSIMVGRYIGEWVFGVEDVNAAMKELKNTADEWAHQQGRMDSAAIASAKAVADEAQRSIRLKEQQAEIESKMAEASYQAEKARKQFEAVGWYDVTVSAVQQAEMKQRMEDNLKLAKQYKKELEGIEDAQRAMGAEAKKQAAENALFKAAERAGDAGRYGGMNPNQIALLKAEEAGLADTEDYRRLAASEATRAARAEYAAMAKEAEHAIERSAKLIEQYEQEAEIARRGLKGRDAERYKMEQRGEDSSVLSAFDAATKEINKRQAIDKTEAERRRKALAEDKKLTDEANRIIERQQGPLDKLIKTRGELDQMLGKNKLSIDQYNEALREAEQQAHRDYTAQFRSSGIDAVASNSAEMMAKLEEYRLGARALPRMTSQRAVDRTAVAEAGNPYAGRPDLASAAQPGAPQLERMSTGIDRLVELAQQYWTKGVSLNLTGANLGGG